MTSLLMPKNMYLIINYSINKSTAIEFIKVDTKLYQIITSLVFNLPIEHIDYEKKSIVFSKSDINLYFSYCLKSESTDLSKAIYLDFSNISELTKTKAIFKIEKYTITFSVNHNIQKGKEIITLDCPMIEIN